MNSKQFSFNRENARHVFHVFLWTMGSAFVAMAISLLGVIEVPTEYIWVVPLINTALVALQQFIAEQRS